MDDRNLVSAESCPRYTVRHVKAWVGVRVANGGPGNSPEKSLRGLKGRNNFASSVPPFQGGEDLLRMFTRGFTPSYHMTGFHVTGINYWPVLIPFIGHAAGRITKTYWCLRTCTENPKYRTGPLATYNHKHSRK